MTRAAHALRKPRMAAALALLVIGAANVAGCGGNNEADLGPPVAPPSTQDTASNASATQAVPATQAALATQAAPATQAAKPRAKDPRAAKARARTTPATKTATPATTTATPAPAAKKPAAKPKPSKEAPLACLRQAKLRKPAKSGDGLWRGQLPRSGKPVFVDGPYKTPAEAESSVASLEGVEDAAKGGLYVVSAALTSKAGPVVRKVAKCLQARG